MPIEAFFIILRYHLSFLISPYDPFQEMVILAIPISPFLLIGEILLARRAFLALK